MQRNFSYRHLYYFWVVGKEGGIAKAAARVGAAVQTVSAQVRQLERSLGCMLLKPSGRGVALTDAGMEAMRQAERIFELGEKLPAAVREAGNLNAIGLRIGIADALPKIVSRQLLAPIVQTPGLRLRCEEGALESLLADLALHHLDLVLTDCPAAPSLIPRLSSHLLGSYPVGWYAPASLLAAASDGFPHSLAKVPMLLPTRNASIRARIDQWLTGRAIRPRVVGEFTDAGLLKTFGESGMGVFPAAELAPDSLARRYNVDRIGACSGVTEDFFAVVRETPIMHPLLKRILAARDSRGVAGGSVRAQSEAGGASR